MLLLLSRGFGLAQQDDNQIWVMESQNNTISVASTAGSVKISVCLDKAYDDTVTVQYGTQDDSATAPNDYLAILGTLVYAPGETVQQIVVTIVNNPASQASKTFTVSTSLAQYADDIPNSAIVYTTVTITPPPPPPTVQFSAATYSVSVKAKTIDIEVTLSDKAAWPVTVKYKTADGPDPNGATAGVDYATTEGTLTFAPGDISATFTVPILDVKDYGLSETVTLTLSEPSGANPGDPMTAVLTIIDDTPPPVLASVTVSATGGQFSPDPAPVGTPVQATLSAKATRPTVGSEYTLSAPSWVWSLLNGQYTCPPVQTSLTTGIDGSDYSCVIVAAPAPPPDATYDYSAVTLYANFTTPGIWQMNVNVQVNYTDDGGGTYEGEAQAQAKGKEWNVDNILRSSGGVTDFEPLDQGNNEYAIVGQYIVVKPRITPNGIQATFKWAQPTSTVFTKYTMNTSKGKVEPCDDNWKLIPLPDSYLATEVLKFYWVDAGGKTLQCTATVGQKLEVGQPSNGDQQT
jgi:hypothetical protein